MSQVNEGTQLIVSDAQMKQSSGGDGRMEKLDGEDLSAMFS
jgi:hypothetical protein